MATPLGRGVARGRGAKVVGDHFSAPNFGSLLVREHTLVPLRSPLSPSPSPEAHGHRDCPCLSIALVSRAPEPPYDDMMFIGKMIIPKQRADGWCPPPPQITISCLYPLPTWPSSPRTRKCEEMKLLIWSRHDRQDFDLSVPLAVDRISCPSLDLSGRDFVLRSPALSCRAAPFCGMHVSPCPMVAGHHASLA